MGKGKQRQKPNRDNALMTQVDAPGDSHAAE